MSQTTITIVPTQIVQENYNSVSDAWQYFGDQTTAFQTGGDAGGSDSDYYSFDCFPALRWNNVQIPAGATVVDCRLELTTEQGSGHYPVDHIQFIAEDSCVPFTADSSPRTRALTTDFINSFPGLITQGGDVNPDPWLTPSPDPPYLTPYAYGYGWWEGSQAIQAECKPDGLYPHCYRVLPGRVGMCKNLASGLQEVISRPGWQSGNSIGIRISADDVASGWRGAIDYWVAFLVNPGIYAQDGYRMKRSNPDDTTDTRTWSFDGSYHCDQTWWPKLVVTYDVAGFDMPPISIPPQIATLTLVGIADGVFTFPEWAVSYTINTPDLVGIHRDSYRAWGGSTWTTVIRKRYNGSVWITI